jgi:hypothetical protein
VYDQGRYQGYWCFVPLSTTTPSEIQLTTTVCERTQVQGGVIPDLCRASISLSTLVEFSKAASSSPDCEHLAEELLGVRGPESLDGAGCVGSPNGRGITIVVLAFLTWSRRRRSSARESRQSFQVYSLPPSAVDSRSEASGGLTARRPRVDSQSDGLGWTHSPTASRGLTVRRPRVDPRPNFFTAPPVRARCTLNRGAC